MPSAVAALALLSVLAATPSADPTHRGEQDRHPQGHEQVTQPLQTATPYPTPIPTRERDTQTPTQTPTEQANCIGYIQGVPLGTVADWGLLLAAVVASIIALRTLNAMKTQTQIAASGLAASSASAKAAEASATAAERALKADRPFLLVPTVEVRGFNTTDAHPLTVPLIAWVYFHNFGRGPAILEEILLRLVLVEPGMYPSPRDYADTASVPLNSVVIVEPGKRSHFETNERDGLDARAEVGTLIPRQKELIVYGRVRYRDVAGASWETGFLWAYHPAGQQWGPTRLWGDEYVSPGPSSHNYGT